ncbi:hypothetical protein GCM10007862_30660 [Dyella lipolytica]|uniref:HAD family hydrolase n=1 Tax=Dyella lipolytica TaxID=1867835 RepID=A0ABW8IVW2_9GAMM|nr:HAD-IIIC family phosphatase [Dyella lipolytica]GLQ48015.1 hypothetical protein GCM10007862_30660 [Dyella lipolytica]
MDVRKFHLEQNNDATFNYFKLMKEVKRLGDLKAKIDRKVKLAFLADCATQHLTMLAQVIGANRGLDIEVYEAGYDTIELEAFNPSSALYAFNPDFIVILKSAEKLKHKFYAAPHADAAGHMVQHLSSIWNAIKTHSRATIVQSTFVVPLERPFGNYGRMLAGALDQFFTDVNHKLVEAARSERQVVLNDVDFLAAAVGRRNWIDEKMWALAKEPCALEYMPLLAHNLVDLIGSAIGKVVKCVVLDLDNTLWGGVIGDDGLEGIRLGDLEDGEAFVAFQHFILGLKRRGIILAVCSKNDHHNAILPFQSHPEMVLKETDIAVFVANWNNKADNIHYIQQTLNIGLDSIVFLDDNPFERDLVRKMLPEVIVPEMPEDPSQYIRVVAELNLFETASFSEADAERADMYRVEAQREQAKTGFERIEDYLLSLDMVITLERFNAFNLPRIAQLIQRSNQFNLTTRRYSESDCEQLMNDGENAFPFTLTLEDRFGNYGLISVVVLKRVDSELVIDEYLMSCRVLQRGVENFAMNGIFGLARQLGLTSVRGSYIPSKKNGMVKDFYAGFGFEKIHEESDGTTQWLLPTDAYLDQPALMRTGTLDFLSST